MKLQITNAFKQAAGLGIIAGMRTFSAPAVISHVYSRHPSKQIKGTSLNFMQTIPASKVFKVLGAGELVGDKMPFAPKRTAAGGLAGRFLSGALCGATVYKANHKQPVIGGLIGGAAAIASAFGCMFLRIGLAKRSGLPDPVIGAIEDAIVISAGTAIAKSM
ncbi:DUF4126 family protein [Mucilaginibacter phyllosphaerae]|uniref:DUF4126 family protein n=1 Tax=Mucilaginibacter phyllosphaerae TaxID=1812349 RepID=A0A4Y8ADH6_9SPHI|nr:DUF4126 family protein [Mucilaginibacter phyllosphaerae]MBB3969084.1 putative membrane protein [Mucilaginibacter phyllosphaerae]TEW66099.1 DUF4126 family protein [Mucilaginibacter phyllosphaerae]GGH06136.1 DUF4126 domain-containing protein [Mucilaginibacter phyllosphaerae]